MRMPQYHSGGRRKQTRGQREEGTWVGEGRGRGKGEHDQVWGNRREALRACRMNGKRQPREVMGDPLESTRDLGGESLRTQMEGP